MATLAFSLPLLIFSVVPLPSYQQQNSATYTRFEQVNEEDGTSGYWENYHFCDPSNDIKVKVSVNDLYSCELIPEYQRWTVNRTHCPTAQVVLAYDPDEVCRHLLVWVNTTTGNTEVSFFLRRVEQGPNKPAGLHNGAVASSAHKMMLLTVSALLLCFRG